MEVVKGRTERGNKTTSFVVDGRSHLHYDSSGCLLFKVARDSRMQFAYKLQAFTRFIMSYLFKVIINTSYAGHVEIRFT